MTTTDTAIPKYVPLRASGAIGHGTAAWTSKPAAIAAVKAIHWPLTEVGSTGQPIPTIRQERTWDGARVWVLSDRSGEGYVSWAWYREMEARWADQHGTAG